MSLSEALPTTAIDIILTMIHLHITIYMNWMPLMISYPQKFWEFFLSSRHESLPDEQKLTQTINDDIDADLTELGQILEQLLVQRLVVVPGRLHLLGRLFSQHNSTTAQIKSKIIKSKSSIAHNNTVHSYSYGSVNNLMHQHKSVRLHSR